MLRLDLIARAGLVTYTFFRLTPGGGGRRQNSRFKARSADRQRRVGWLEVGVRRVLGLASALLILAAGSACSASKTKPRTITISITDLNQNEMVVGTERFLNIDVVGTDATPRCTSDGGTFGEATRISTATFTRTYSILFTATREGEVRNTCTVENTSGLMFITIVSTAPGVFEYEGSLPQFLARPESGPNLAIYHRRDDGVLILDNPRCNPLQGLTQDCIVTWRGGNSWTFSFPAGVITRRMTLIRFVDTARWSAEGHTTPAPWYCSVIRFNGAAAVPAAPDQLGCLAQFQ